MHCRYFFKSKYIVHCSINYSYQTTYFFQVIPGKYTWQKAIERCKKASGTLGKLKFDDFCKTTDIKAWFGFGTVTSEEDYIEQRSKIRVTYLYISSNWQSYRKGVFLSLHLHDYKKYNV